MTIQLFWKSVQHKAHTLIYIIISMPNVLYVYVWLNCIMHNPPANHSPDYNVKGSLKVRQTMEISMSEWVWTCADMNDIFLSRHITLRWVYTHKRFNLYKSRIERYSSILECIIVIASSIEEAVGDLTQQHQHAHDVINLRWIRGIGWASGAMKIYSKRWPVAQVKAQSWGSAAQILR